MLIIIVILIDSFYRGFYRFFHWILILKSKKR